MRLGFSETTISTLRVAVLAEEGVGGVVRVPRPRCPGAPDQRPVPFGCFVAIHNDSEEMVIVSAGDFPFALASLAGHLSRPLTQPI